MSPSTTAVPSARLLPLARAEQHRAKQLRTYRWAAHGVTFAIGLVGLWLSAEASYVAALLAACSESVAWVLRQRSRARHQHAEKGKRIAELRLFYDPSAATGAETDFRRAVSSWACEHADEQRFDDSDYWDSSPGMGRDSLRRSVREAAWWSWNLYEEGVKRAGWFAAATVGFALLLLVLFLFVGLAEAAEEVARITLLVITGLIGADALSLRADWTAAASDSRAAHLSLTPPANSEADLFSLYVDYRALTAGTEPIPDWIYRRHRERLNAAWRAENGAS
ncbi:MAG: hypothetical protein ABW167_15840 [Baekduia sp.]